MNLKLLISRISRKKFIYTVNFFLAFIYFYSATRTNPFSIKVQYTQLNIKNNKNSTRQLEEFDNILKIDCNVSLNKYPLNCLQQVKLYDKKYQRQKTCNECFYDAATTSKLIIYHHTFWNLDIKNSTCYKFQMRILKLNIMSYLATQNLCCTRFILWKLDNFPVKPMQEIENFFQYYIKHGILQIKTFNLNDICKDATSSFSLTKLCSRFFYRNVNLSKRNDLVVALSDLIRFVVLELYPGIYTDGDVIYLKDMRDLWHFNFAYRWSLTLDFNTAILGINSKLDARVEQIYESILNSFSFGLSGFYYLFHPYKVSRLVKNLNDGKSSFGFEAFRVLNSVLFDPAWICKDGGGNLTQEDGFGVCQFTEFNKETSLLAEQSNFSIEDFFVGAFTYHIHFGNLGCVIEEKSFLRYFEFFYLKKLRHLQNS